MDTRAPSPAPGRRFGAALVITLAVAGAATLQACASADSGAGGIGGFQGSGAGGRTMGVDGGSDAASGAGGSLGAGGSSAGLGGRTASGTGGAGVPVCRVRIVPLSVPSFTGIEAGARLRVQGTVQGAMTSPVVWQWTVTFDGATPIVPSTIDGAGSIIDFPIDRPGTYDITASLAREPNCYWSELVRTVEAQPTAFVLRASADGYPVKDTRIVLGADPQQAVPVLLERGQPASLFPTRLSTGQALPSYLRVSRPASDFSLEGDTLHGPFSAQLLPDVSYDLLIVPNDAVAPDLLTGLPSSFAARVSLDPGVPITATLRDGIGRPVVGARMVLRRGALPSTVGISDGSGALSLLARAGTLAAFIVPPAAAGLPRISVGAAGDPGIVLDAAAAALDLTVSWDSTISAPLTVEVRAPGGSALVEGARVRAVSQGPGLRAGMLVARTGAGDVNLPALGASDIELTTNTVGRAIFAALPVGTYDVTIVPPTPLTPAGGAAPAITEAALTVAAGGPIRMVTLAQKGLLAGTLLPLPDSVGARVTAIDKSIAAPGTVVSAMVAADGSYTLSVDPGRDYQLLAEPAPGTTRGRAVLETVHSAAGTTRVGSHTLPLVHVVPGVVTSGAAGPGVGGVLLQAFCVAASSRCLDPTVPLADAISAGNGTFALRLPEPAQN